jgi:hypothetical protein
MEAATAAKCEVIQPPTPGGKCRFVFDGKIETVYVQYMKLVVGIRKA